MVRASPLQAAFNAGEFSPRMVARVDFNKYPSGCSILENLIPLVEGGVIRRPGSRFVVETKTSSEVPRLIPFEFSTTQAYMTEFGNAFVRFLRNQGQITSNNITASITNGTFDSDIANWTDRSGASSSISHNGTLNAMNLVSNGTTNGHAEQQVTNALAAEHVIAFRIRGIANDTVHLRIGTSSTGTELVDDVAFGVGWHCYAFTATAADFYVQFLHKARNKTVQVDDISLIDNAAIEIGSAYAEAQLFQIKRAQSADTLYLAHTSHTPYKLTRSGHTSWSMTEVDFNDGPFLTTNTTATTLAPSATTGLGINITASAVTGINGGQGFISTDVGRLIRIQHSSAWGSARIHSITSTTVVVADVQNDFGATTAQAAWRLGSWSGTTGYPGSVTFFEQRLLLAGSTDNPQTFWYSQTGDFENMRPDDGSGTVADDDALDFTISADEVNAIRWMTPGTSLVIGTTGGEWVVTSDGPIVTPTDIEVKRHTKHGSANVAPIRIDQVTLFLQRAERKIREFAFNFEADSFLSPDMTVLSQHITRSGISEIAYGQEPSSVVWCVRNDGQLAALTFWRPQNVVAWSRHILGGSYLAGDAIVESVATIPGNNGSGQTHDSTGRDEVWLVVRRTIDGSTVRYIEFLERDFETGQRQDDAFYVDSALTLDQWNTNTARTLQLTVSDNSDATLWEDGDTGTMTAVGFTPFLSGDVGDTWELASGGDKVQLEITAFTSSSVVTVEFLQDVPSSIRNVALSDWLDPDDKTTSVTGLSHLEGETVKVYADGGTHPDRTVSSGTITLQAAAGKAQVGLGYTHKLHSLKMESGAKAGTALGKIKRIAGVTLILLDSLVASMGPDADSLEVIPFREVTDPMDRPPPLFTGERFVEFDDDYDRDTRIVIESDAPAPFTLLAWAPELQTQDPG